MGNFEPSIKCVSEDARGEIFVISLPDDQELLLLHSKQGVLRGGHSHDVNEIVVILSGCMAYSKRDDMQRQEWGETLKAGDDSFNPAGQIHMGEALTDLWLIEMKLNTAKGQWSNQDYLPWRERVLESSR